MQKRPTLDAFLTKSDLASTRTAANSKHGSIVAQDLPAEQQTLQDGLPGQHSYPAAAQQQDAVRIPTLRQGVRQLPATSSQSRGQTIVGLQQPAACDMVQATPAAPLPVPVLVLTPEVLTISPTPEQLPIPKRKQQCFKAVQQYQQCSHAFKEQQGGLQQRSTAARYVAPVTPVPTKSQQRRQQQQQKQAQQNEAQYKQAHEQQLGAPSEPCQENHLLQVRSKLGEKDTGGSTLPAALRRICKNSLTLMRPGHSAVEDTTARQQQQLQQKQQTAKRSLKQLYAEQQPQQHPEVQQEDAHQEQQQHQPQPKQRRVTWTLGDCTPKSAAAVAGAAAAVDMVQPDISAVPVASFFSSVVKTPAAPAAADQQSSHTTVTVVGATPLTDQAMLHAALAPGSTAADAQAAQQRAGEVPEVVEATPLTDPAAAATAVVSTARRSGSTAAGTLGNVVAATPYSAVLCGTIAALAAASGSTTSVPTASAAKPGRASATNATWGRPPPTRGPLHGAAAAAAASDKENIMPPAMSVALVQPVKSHNSQPLLGVKPGGSCWPSSRGQKQREMQLELELQRLAAAGSAAPAAVATAHVAGLSAASKVAAAAAASEDDCLAVSGPAAAAAEDSSDVGASSAAGTCAAAAAACAVLAPHPPVNAADAGRAEQGNPTPVATQGVSFSGVSLAAATYGTPAAALATSFVSSTLQDLTQLTSASLAAESAQTAAKNSPAAGSEQLLSLGPSSLAAATHGTPASAAAAAAAAVEASLTPVPTQNLTELAETAAAPATAAVEMPAAAATAIAETPAAAGVAVRSAEAEEERHSPVLDATQDGFAPSVLSLAAATCGTPAVATAAAARGQILPTLFGTQDLTQLGGELQDYEMQVSYASATCGTLCTPVAVASVTAAPTAAAGHAQFEQPAASSPAARSFAAAAVTNAQAIMRDAQHVSPILSTHELCLDGLSLVAVQGTAPDQCQDAVGALTEGDQSYTACEVHNEQQLQQQQRRDDHCKSPPPPQQQQRGDHGKPLTASNDVGLSDDKFLLQKHEKQQQATGAVNGQLQPLQAQQQQQQEQEQQEEEVQKQQQAACSSTTESPATIKQQCQAAQQHRPVDSTTTAVTPAERSRLEQQQQQQQQHSGQRRSMFICASPVFSLTFIDAALQYAEQLQREPMVACSHWKGPRPAQPQQQQLQGGQSNQLHHHQQQQGSHQQGGVHQRQRQQQQQAQLPPLPAVLHPQAGHQRQGDHAQLPQQEQVAQQPPQAQQQLRLLQQPVQEQAEAVRPCHQPQNVDQPQQLQQELQQQALQPRLQPPASLPLQMQHMPLQQQQQMWQQQQQQRASLDPLSCLQHLDLSQLLTQVPKAQGALVRISQTQSPFDVTPEVADLSFHDRGVRPYVLVCESFPFQKDAIAFAAWCNAVGPVAVAALQRECRARNFRSFPERQQFLQQWMQQHQPQQQQQQQQQQDAVQQAHQEQQQHQDRMQQVQQQPEQQDPAAAHTIGSATGKGATAAARSSSSSSIWASNMAAEGPPPVALHGCTAGAAAAPAPAAAAAAGVGATDASSAGSGSRGWQLPWVRVFTEEYEGRNGYTRRFLAASYSALWRRHINTPVGRRHFYEVIQAGCPCHLYFDLEYSVAANPGVCGDEVVNILVRLVREEFQRQWGIDIRKQWVVELDSSTSEKFSRHLIIRVPGWAFRDNTQVGALVRLITCRAEAIERLFLYKEPKQQQQQQQQGVPAAGACRRMRVCFVDGAVYSKNRHFRLLGSSKGGKRAVLEPTLRYAMSAASRNALPVRPHQLFLMSLISNVHPDSQLLDVMPPLPSRGPQQQHRGGVLAAAAAVAGTDDDEVLVQYPIRPGAGPIVFGNEVPIGQAAAYRTVKATWGPMAQQQQQQQQLGQEGLPGAGAGGGGAVNMKSSGSGFMDPAVLQEVVLASVDFLEEEATRRAGGAPAQVRTIAYCGHAVPCQRHAAFAFSLIGPGSHMCANIGRSHKHNHVFFIMDYANGTFSQKCHDPDCWGYRSPWQQLPPHVWQKERLLGNGSGSL